MRQNYLFKEFHSPSCSCWPVVKSHMSHHGKVGQKFPAAPFDNAIFFKVIVIKNGFLAVELNGKFVVGLIGLEVRFIKQSLQELFAFLIH